MVKLMVEIDASIIKAAAGRSSDAFRKLYDYYSPFVWKVVYRTVNGDKDASAQIMQDVFIKVYLSIKSYRFEAAFSTWLYRIAFTKSMNYLRRHARRRRRFGTLDEAIGGATVSERIEARDLIRRALAALTPEERFLLTAREVDNISFDELEKITGRTQGSMRTRISRIKDNLRKDFAYERS